MTTKRKKKPDYYKEQEKKRKKQDADLQTSIARREKLCADLREDSGKINTGSRIASFLYEAMRDGEISPGAVVRILADTPGGLTELTNGFLGKFAIWAARELLR